MLRAYPTFKRTAMEDRHTPSFVRKVRPVTIVAGLLVTALLLGSVTAASASSPTQQREVCAGTSLPAGWIVVDARWSATRCGEGSPSDPNVKVIRRLGPGDTGIVLEGRFDGPIGRVRLPRGRSFWE